MQRTHSAVYTDTKPHYLLLDALRGVAALIVICFHFFEGFATSGIDQGINHGYLAVDFFFILSGFVIGYAYDDRWKKMSVKDYFKRRIIRLHPMVVMGAVIGLVTFCIQGSEKWDGTHVAFSAVLLALLLNLFLLPAVPGTTPEIRGNGEMYPLNGPSWSLFFEYIGNILYALFIHRLPTKALLVLVILSGVGLSSFALLNLSGTYSIGVGWTLNDLNLPGGFLRMLFSYTAGMYISRIFRPRRIKGAFAICSVILIGLLVVPYFGTEPTPINGLYDSFCVIIAFPILIYIAASGRPAGAKATTAYRWLGNLSYPLYMVHYPFMYLFFSWLWKNNIPLSQAWPVGLGVIVASIIVATLCYRLYDVPLRRWLSNKYVNRGRS